MALFDIRELIKMAVKDEETGIAFYQALAESTDQPEIKDGIQAIAAEEEHHRDRFKGMLEKAGEWEPVEEYSGQYEDYVNALLENRAFPKPEDAAEEARSVANDAEAIDIAIGLEKDTLLFQQEMRGFISPEYNDFVDEIIDEERKHVKDLTRLKSSLK